MIWEVMCGFRDAKTAACSNGTLINNIVANSSGHSVAAVKSKYQALSGRLTKFLTTPSGMSASKDAPGSIKATENGGKFTATIPTNGELDIASLKESIAQVNASNPGLNAKADGQGQNIVLTTDKSPDGVVFEIKKLDESLIEAANSAECYIYFDSSKNQELLHGSRPASHPFYFKLGAGTVSPPEPPGEDYEIEIMKYESGTETPLSGAQFEVLYLGGSGEVIVPPVIIDPDDPGNPTIPKPDVPPVTDPEKHFITTVTTDGSGKSLIKVPYAGIYQITEKVPPVGHKLAEQTIQTVTVTSDTPTAHATYHNEPFTGVSIQKIDAQTREPLAGATFKLEAVNGEAAPQTGISNNSGMVLFENLPAGSYKVTEISPPPNYHLAEIPVQTVELKANETASLVFEDQPYTGLNIKKIDAQSKAPLSGATFRLEAVNGEIATPRTGISDANGIVHFENLPCGSYKVTEISPPLNYHLSEIPVQTVELKANETATLIFEDQPYTGVSIKKIDAQSKAPLTGATFKLEAVNGEISTPRTGMTDANGIVRFENLPCGSYKVTEISPPPNYHLAKIPVQTVELTPDRTAELVFEDEPYSGFKIRKVDAHNGAGLAGAVFTIHVKDGELVGEYITDINGLIIKGDLPEGWYTITEKQAPDGYLIDEEFKVKDIYIRPEDDVEVVFRDFKKPELLIQKIDSSTGKKLEGAVFRVKEKDGAKYTDVTTGTDGSVLLKGLEEGWYTVTKIRAPSGYIIDDTVHSIELVAGKTSTLTVDNSQKPSLRIHKIDELTGEGLGGVTLRIAKDGSDVYQDVTTDKDGYATINGLEPGPYTVTEIHVPDSHILDSTPHHIILEPGKTAELQIQNQRKIFVKIMKTDSITKQPLQYAVFNISLKNGLDLGNFTTNQNGEILLENASPGLYIIKEIKAPDGYLLLETPTEIQLEPNRTAVVELENTPVNPLLIKKVDSKTGEPLAGATFRIEKVNGEFVAEETTGRNGFITITGIDPGFYVVTEIKAPDGYILDGAPKTIELKRGSPASVEFTNTRTSELQLLKVDAVTKKPLAGVKFRLTQMNGEFVGEYTTDSAGKVSVGNLAPGWYTANETATVSGYILDPTPKNVEIVKGKPAVLEFTNQPLTGLQIKKVDDVTGEPLAGVQFKLSYMDGRTIGTYTTDGAGVIFIPNLQEGWYVIQEVKAPDGYKPDLAPRNIELKNDQLNIVEYRNQPWPTLVLRKIDSQTGKVMAGVKLRLYDQFGRELGTFTTNTLGKITLSGMEAGKYSVQEIETLPGYELDSTVHEFQLDWGKITTIELKNQPKSTLSIKKVDAKTGKSIYGVTFLLYDAKNNVVGEYTTDQNGTIHFPSELPEGKYKIKEIKAADGYILDETVRTVILKAGETTEIKITNEPERGRIRIEKVSAEYNDYTKLKKGSNLSGAVFAVINRDHEVVDRMVTNRHGMATSKDDMSTEVSYRLDCRREALGLKAGEYITDIKFEFGTVQAGFHDTKGPRFICTVNADLPNDYRFTNCVDVGGQRFDEWTIAKDCWTTYVWSTPKGKLPKTGF